MRKIGIHTQHDHPRIRYTIEFLSKHPLTQAAGLSLSCNSSSEETNLNIAYSANPKDIAFDFFIPAQGLFQESSKLINVYYSNAYSHHNQTLYSVESEEKTEITPLLIGQHFNLIF